MKKALFTNVCSEPIFLPVWLSYYSKFFPGEDIYLITNNIVDDSIKKAKGKYGVIEVPRESLTVYSEYQYKNLQDPAVIVKLLESFLWELLDEYELVVTCDIDELIIPDTDKYKDFGDYLEKNTKDIDYCTGYEVMQDNSEADIDYTKPLLKQRKYWRRDDFYDKPYILKKKIQWVPGRHGLITDVRSPNNPELFLVHLHRFDYKAYFSRPSSNRTQQDFQYKKEEWVEIPERIRNVI